MSWAIFTVTWNQGQKVPSWIILEILHFKWFASLILNILATSLEHILDLCSNSSAFDTLVSVTVICYVNIL